MDTEDGITEMMYLIYKVAQKEGEVSGDSTKNYCLVYKRTEKTKINLFILLSVPGGIYG